MHCHALGGKVVASAAVVHKPTEVASLLCPVQATTQHYGINTLQHDNMTNIYFTPIRISLFKVSFYMRRFVMNPASVFRGEYPSYATNK